MTQLGQLLCHCAAAKPTKHTTRHLIVFRKEDDCRACHAYLAKKGIAAAKRVSGAAMLSCHLDKRVSWQALRAHPGIRYIEEDHKAKMHPVQQLRTRSGANCRCDKTAPRLTWNIRQVQSPLVWPVTRGGGVRLAIVDSGIARHPDLRIAGGVDTTGVGSYEDDNGHGTHVAGIAAAIGIRGGVTGVAPRAELYAVKVLDRYGFGFISDIVDGVYWCIRHRMQVINMSLGVEPGIQSRALREAIRRAARCGIVIAASAGNDGVAAGGLDAPASYPETIAVAASTRRRRIASLSSRGVGIDITAPGEDICSTWPGGGYTKLSGTSMASPHVAGAAALLLAAQPQLTGRQVRQALERSAKPLRGYTRFSQGKGLLQCAAALQRAIACRRAHRRVCTARRRRATRVAVP